MAAFCSLALTIRSTAQIRSPDSSRTKIEIYRGMTNAEIPTDIRVFELDFFSTSLRKNKTLSVVAPIDRDESSVLVILHGRGRHHRSLLDVPTTRTQLLETDSWILLPDGEDGWYINSPFDSLSLYEDYLTEVITVATRALDLTTDPADRTIAGWSMGGYGAMQYAINHPDQFFSVASIIGLLDFPREENLPAGRNYTVPSGTFGTDLTIWQEFNPINQVEALAGRRILIVTADDAFDKVMNDNFARALSAARIPFEIRRLTGGHTFEIVQRSLRDVLEFATRHTVKRGEAR